MSVTHDRERLCRGYFYRDANLPYILGVPPPPACAASAASTIGTHALAAPSPVRGLFPARRRFLHVILPPFASEAGAVGPGLSRARSSSPRHVSTPRSLSGSALPVSLPRKRGPTRVATATTTTYGAVVVSSPYWTTIPIRPAGLGHTKAHARLLVSVA
jgi:hypothetical protein